MFDQPLKDSGERRNFSTGAVRDVARGKGRMDLLPPDALIALSKHFEKGAEKYAERNWEKGIPYTKYLDSGIRHAVQCLNGETDEPHAVAAAWNFLCLVQTMIWVDKGILPSTLDDLPRRIAVVDLQQVWDKCICPDGGPHDEMCPVCIAHDVDEYGAPEGADDSVAYTGTGTVPPAAVSDEDAAAIAAYEKAARTVFGDYLDHPFMDEELPPGIEVIPPRVRTFVQKSVKKNPGLALVQFVGDKGEFVYRNGERVPTGDWTLSCYDGDDEWLEV